MPLFGGNPNHSLNNPYKPGYSGVGGMQPHNILNAITGRMQPQASRPTVPNTTPNINRLGASNSPFPTNPTPGALRRQPGIDDAINQILASTARPLLPYVPQPNTDLLGRLMQLQRDLSGAVTPLRDALLGSEADLLRLLRSQTNDPLRDLLGQTDQAPVPRPRSGTSFFRGFSM